MKKFAKMSLVAAIAVAGLTSTATAGSLEEAIKGVNISGSVQYTMEKDVQKSDGNDSEAQHDIDVSITAVVPVNDMVTATLRLDEANDDDTDADSQGATAKNSGSLNLDLDRAFFTYNNNGLTASFGLMSAPASIDQQGDGVTVAKTINDITLSAGYFYNTGMDTDEVYYAGIDGAVSGVTYGASYHVKDNSSSSNNDGTATDTGADMLIASLSTTIENISLAVNYTARDSDISTTDKQTQFKLTAGTTVGPVALEAIYGVNGKNGGQSTFDDSDTAASTISIGDLVLNDEGDASAFVISGSIAVGEKGTAKLTYATTDNDAASTDMDVIVAKYTYAMSSNFSTWIQYEVNKDETTTVDSDHKEFVLGAKYSF